MVPAKPPRSVQPRPVQPRLWPFRALQPRSLHRNPLNLLPAPPFTRQSRRQPHLRLPWVQWRSSRVWLVILPTLTGVPWRSSLRIRSNGRDAVSAIPARRRPPLGSPAGQVFPIVSLIWIQPIVYEVFPHAPVSFLTAVQPRLPGLMFWNENFRFCLFQLMCFCSWTSATATERWHRARPCCRWCFRTGRRIAGSTIAFGSPWSWKTITRPKLKVVLRKVTATGPQLSELRVIRGDRDQGWKGVQVSFNTVVSFQASKLIHNTLALSGSFDFLKKKILKFFRIFNFQMWNKLWFKTWCFQPFFRITRILSLNG